MTAVLSDMLNVLVLEKIEENLFRGESRDIGSRNVFGGQVIGQALMAASHTVNGRRANSLHAYFLRPGDKNTPILYEVEHVRDGRSFSTRRVVAIQHGRPIFDLTASFQTKEEGFEHQSKMPDAPDPDGLPTMADLQQAAAKLDPDRFKHRPIRKLALDIRPVLPSDPFMPSESNAPFQSMWFRTWEELPSDNALHQSILAYSSDFFLIRTAILPHIGSFRGKNTHLASLDHAMWFHRDFRIDEWLLFVMESPSASGARGFATGNVYGRDGRLVASIAQEGLIRVTEKISRSEPAQELKDT